jgi:hypothetical protein
MSTGGSIVVSVKDPACQHAPYTRAEARRRLGREDEIKLDDTGKPYTWRGAENVDKWWMLPVDIDGQQSIAQAKAFFLDYAYVAFTSFSHHLTDGATEKFRLFLLLKEPVPHEEFEKRRAALLQWLGAVDKSSLAGSRGFYLPSCPHDRVPLAQRWYNDRPLCLDVMSFPPTVPRTVPTLKPLTAAEQPALLSLLHDTFLGNYEQWWKVAVAMVSAGFSCTDFEYVTIGGMMNQKDFRDCQQQWRKAEARVRRGRTISVGYLYNLVGGWEAVEQRRIATRKRELEEKIAGLQKIAGGAV